MNNKESAIIIIVALSFIAGVAVTMIIETRNYNTNLELKINTIADSDKPLFRIGDDVFRIERVNMSFFEVTDNDFVNPTP